MSPLGFEESGNEETILQEAHVSDKLKLKSKCGPYNLPYNASEQQIQQLFDQAGLNISFEKFMAMSQEVYVKWRLHGGLNKSQLKLLSDTRKRIKKRYNERKNFKERALLVSEIFDNTKPITKDQIQKVLDENGINFSVNFLSRMGYEKCRFFTTKSERFNDNQKAIIAKCKRQLALLRYQKWNLEYDIVAKSGDHIKPEIVQTEKTPNNSPSLSNQVNAKTHLSQAQIQTILDQNAIGFTTKRLKRMYYKEYYKWIDEKCRRYTDKQKDVIKQCMALVRPGFGEFAKKEAAPINFETCEVLVEPLKFKTEDNQEESLDKNSTDMPPIIPNKSSEKQIQEILIKAGIKDPLSKIMALDKIEFFKYRRQKIFTLEQKELLARARSLLLSRYATRRQRLSQALSNNKEDFPKGARRTPAQLQEILHRHGININMEKLCSMRLKEFKKWMESFSKSKKYTHAQQKIISKCRLRMKILQSTNSWLLKDYNLEKGKRTKIKTTHGDNKNEILKAGGFETSQSDIRQIDKAYKILQKKEPKEISMPKEISQQDSTADGATVPYLTRSARKRWNLEPIELSESMMKTQKIPSKRNDETPEDSFETPRYKVIIEKKSGKRKIRIIRSQASVCLRKPVAIPINPDETEPFIVIPEEKQQDIDNLNQLKSPTKIKLNEVIQANQNEPEENLHQLSPTKPIDEDTILFLQDKIQDDDTLVNIQVVGENHKIFVKLSKSYPGHVYTYSFKSFQQDDKDSRSIEIYECASCVNTASNYKSLSAQKYVMDTLKTIQVSGNRIISGNFDGMGHVCVPLELVKKRYQL